MNIDWKGADDIELLFGDLINEVSSYASVRDHDSIPIPNSILQKFTQSGIFHYMLPKKFGGKEMGDAVWGDILEKIGYLSSDTSLPFLLSIRMSFISALIATKRDDIIERYIQPLISGEISGAFAYTENADAFLFSSSAQYDSEQNKYILNGVKRYITGGETSELFLVFIPGNTLDLQVFLLERRDAGVEVTPRIMHGVRSLGISQLDFNNVVLEPDRLLVTSDGLSFVQRYFLNCRRSLLPTLFLGRARALIEETIAYLERTIRYGHPITEMQHTQAAIGRMSIALESARAIVFHSLERQARKESDPYWDPVSSMAKHYAVEKINDIALMAMKLTGGWGYTEESNIGRTLRDFGSLLAGADPQEKLEVDLGSRTIHDYQMLQQRHAMKEKQ